MNVNVFFLIEDQFELSSDEEIKAKIKEHYSLLDIKEIQIINEDNKKKVEIFSNLKDILIMNKSKISETNLFEMNVLEMYKNDNNKLKNEITMIKKSSISQDSLDIYISQIDSQNHKIL